MIKGSELVPRIEKICKVCHEKFLSKVHNTTICSECKNERDKLKPCQCGCGQLTKKRWALGCGLRGRTYFEIYGTDNPPCGFAKGDQNPNFTRPKFAGLKYKNKFGENLRSNLEVIFSEFCREQNIPYEYERTVKLINGKRKIVDFVLYDRIFVEISGFAYKSWQDSFITAMDLLRKSVDNPILILAYQKNLDGEEPLIRKCSNIDIFIQAIENKVQTLKSIKLFKRILEHNDYILTQEKNNVCNCKRI